MGGRRNDVGHGTAVAGNADRSPRPSDAIHHRQAVRLELRNWHRFHNWMLTWSILLVSKSSSSLNGRNGGSVFIGKPSLVQPAFPDPARTTVAQPVRIGGNVAPPRKVKDVAPVLSAQAIQAGIRGSVVFEIVVDQTGSISKATVLRSLPFLDQAALDCVKQWEYTPLVIDGMPRSVVMTVTVTFAP